MCIKIKYDNYDTILIFENLIIFSDRGLKKNSELGEIWRIYSKVTKIIC